MTLPREPAAEHAPDELTTGGRSLALAYALQAAVTAHEPRHVPPGDITAHEQARRT